jgi:hypothetical protein
MSSIIYIGVDDTDVIGSVGTGRVARGLAKCFTDIGLGTSLGVSRHQLLVDKRIQYTSHNSSKGLAFVTDQDADEFVLPALDYMKTCFLPGSDPGLCICSEGKINDEIIQFGQTAVKQVLRKQDAIKLAAKYKVFLKELGGSGDGIIGALAAVGLRAWGNEGRLVDLPGIHELKGLVTVGEILARSPIVAVQDIDGKNIDINEIIDSLDWIRPSLVGGQPVLRVQPVLSGNERRWVMIERKHREEGKGEKDD